MGLSMYIVFMHGAVENPVSHIALTITNLSGSLGSRARYRQQIAPPLVADVLLPSRPTPRPHRS